MKDSTQEGQEAAKKLMDALNCCSDHDVALAFIDELKRTHRTLQQCYGKILIESILAFAEMADGNWTDARNEAICELCVKLREVCREQNATYVRRDDEGKQREMACLPFI